jgi:diguanylate cyclase (GGDEF)-like protein
VGDEVLKLVSAEMNRSIREVDLLGRLGGEEFAIILPETDLQGALIVAEKVRLAIEAFSLETEQGLVTFTISIGVTQLSEAKESNEDLIKQADALLYQAKHNGRNRIESNAA